MIVVYVAPLAAWYVHSHHLLVAVYSDELLYSARVVDAYRGGSMASPFLAGHEQASDYMPQMTERAIAGAAHLLGISPLAALAAMRVILPTAIFFLLFSLARNLGIADPMAAIAGGLATLATSQIPALSRDLPIFPRYFRTVSPAAHVALTLIAPMLTDD